MTESARIASLETQVRTLKRMLFGVFGLVVAGAVLGASSANTVPDVIRAKRFEAVNNAGTVLVSIGNMKGGGMDNGHILTKTSRGGTLIEIGAGVGGGILETANGKGDTLVRLTANPYGCGFVLTQDPNGGSLVKLTSTQKGEGAIQTLNGGERILAALAAEIDKGGVLVTFDQDGKAKGVFP